MIAVLHVFLFVIADAAITRAQGPPPPSLPDARLNSVFPAGGMRGTTVEVTINGFDLDNANRLHFDNAGITSEPKLVEPGLGQTGLQPVPNVFKVTIKPDVKPGLYEVRVIGKYGVSTPRAFVVGTQPEMLEVEPNNSIKQANAVAIGTIVNGITKDTATDYFKFSAQQGQRIIIDCWAFRIDSNCDPTLVLFDSDGREIERNRNTNRRDPMIDFTAPRDGEYIVGVSDFLSNYYTLPSECFYRLSISTAPYLDFVFPPAGLPGSQNEFTLYGRNLPGGQLVPGLTVNGKTLEKLNVNIALPTEIPARLGQDLLVDSSEAFIDGIEYRLDSPQGLSNPLLISIAGAPVVIEQEPNNDPSKAQLIKLPCEVVGQFYPRDDQDWIAFEAKKGDVLWIELTSQRLGLPTDPYLLVQQVKKDDKGIEQIIDLHGVDDVEETSSFVHWSFLSGLLFSTATHDPACRFEAPDDGTYRVMVQDLARSSESNPRSVYRLTIRPPQPDFRLVAVPRPPTAAVLEQGFLNITQATTWSPLLRKGGAELIEVFAVRRDGFDGEIRVSADHLPAGVTAASAILTPITKTTAEPVKRSATLVLKAADEAPPGVASISVNGKAMIGSTEVVREARNAAMIWPTLMTGIVYPRSRLTHQLAIAITAEEAAPFSVDVAADLVLETTRTGTVKFPVNVVRRGDFKGAITLKAYGLPPTPGNVVHSQPVYYTTNEIKADQTTADFTMTVPPHAPLGTFTFFVSGVGTVNYARDPEALKASTDRKAAIEQIVADDAARVLKAMADAKTAADKVASSTTGDELKIATEAKLAADKALTEADAQAKLNAAFLQTFNQELAKLQEKSKPTDIVISAPTTTITLKITK
jgi:hypothetical protein